MAESKPKEAKKFYFKSQYSGLQILDDNSNLLERFSPHVETDPTGAKVRVGFLETENEVVAEKVRASGYATEFEDEKEYERALKYATPTGFPVS